MVVHHLLLPMHFAIRIWFPAHATYGMFAVCGSGASLRTAAGKCRRREREERKYRERTRESAILSRLRMCFPHS